MTIIFALIGLYRTAIKKPIKFDKIILMFFMALDIIITLRIASYLF